jgi:hypothetical protein
VRFEIGSGIEVSLNRAIGIDGGKVMKAGMVPASNMPAPVITPPIVSRRKKCSAPSRERPLDTMDPRLDCRPSSRKPSPPDSRIGGNISRRIHKHVVTFTNRRQYAGKLP